ncbi:serine/threonine protein kinase, partial [Streptomyces sp. YC419]|nr:serine/threonine protein kinase [Streptomyces ureilyticus]
DYSDAARNRRSASGLSSHPAATTTTAQPAEPGHPRRATVVLIAGLVALALAFAGLTYALLKDNGGGDESSSTGGTTGGTGNGGSTTGGEDNGGTSGGGDDGTTTSETSGTNGGSTDGGQTSSPPPQSVEVSLSGSNTQYSGACPPPGAEAPTFTATITVGRAPAEVDYRWVTESDEPSDPGWKSLSFSGGDTSQQVNHVETTYNEGGTYENEMSVEVRGPVHTTSDSVAFSVTCETETPTTDGASPTP